MTGRVFTKLFFSFVLVLSISTAVLDFTVRRFMDHSLPGEIYIVRRDLLLASLFAMALAIVLSAYLAQRAAARLNRILIFAGRIAAGDLSARVEEGNLDEISDVAHALDATAARLQSSFATLEARQRELAALLDSMQEAVIAVDAGGRIAWSNTVMQRTAPVAARQAQALCHA